jgi:hypothetical protein
VAVTTNENKLNKQLICFLFLGPSVFHLEMTANGEREKQFVTTRAADWPAVVMVVVVVEDVVVRDKCTVLQLLIDEEKQSIKRCAMSRKESADPKW